MEMFLVVLMSEMYATNLDHLSEKQENLNAFYTEAYFGQIEEYSPYAIRESYDRRETDR